MELGDSSRLVGLHVLQVEAPDQEVVTPDMFRHQVDLPGHKGEQGLRVGGAKPFDRGGVSPRRCGTGWSPRQASSGSTASPRSPPAA